MNIFHFFRPDRERVPTVEEGVSLLREEDRCTKAASRGELFVVVVVLKMKWNKSNKPFK